MSVIFIVNGVNTEEMSVSGVFHATNTCQLWLQNNVCLFLETIEMYI